MEATSKVWWQTGEEGNEENGGNADLMNHSEEMDTDDEAEIMMLQEKFNEAAAWYEDAKKNIDNE